MPSFGEGDKVIKFRYKIRIMNPVHCAQGFLNKMWIRGGNLQYYCAPRPGKHQVIHRYWSGNNSIYSGYLIIL
jgi:hypothetical protein